MSPVEKHVYKQRQDMCRLAGFCSGLLLTLPGIFPVLAPMQAVAFIPLLMALCRVERWQQCLGTGLLMGLAYIAPQVLLYRFPSSIALVLVMYYLAILMTLVCVSWLLACPRNIWSCFAFGAFLVVLDWVNFTALPMWGTAQSFARSWSWYPRIIAFTSVTGITGVIFVLAVIQSLVVMLILERQQRLTYLITLIAVVCIVAIIDIIVLSQKPFGHFKVGAIGWIISNDENVVNPEIPKGFQKLYAEPVVTASKQGAKLLVSPEAAFSVSSDENQDTFSKFLDISRQYNIYLAVGYFNVKTQQNRMAFIGPTEGIMGQYTKTHLTPFEHYQKGTGELGLVHIDEISIGAMICHDDNYTDISRRYGNQATAVVVIPTNDWFTVRRAHLQNTIHRAIESRYAIVRAASNGISAIISAKGELLASSDHFKDGPSLIVVDVPVYKVRTIFSQFGHWFVAASALFMAIHIIRTCCHLGQ